MAIRALVFVVVLFDPFLQPVTLGGCMFYLAAKNAARRTNPCWFLTGAIITPIIAVVFFQNFTKPELRSSLILVTISGIKLSPQAWKRTRLLKPEVSIPLVLSVWASGELTPKT